MCGNSMNNKGGNKSQLTGKQEPNNLKFSMDHRKTNLPSPILLWIRSAIREKHKVRNH